MMDGWKADQHLWVNFFLSPFKQTYSAIDLKSHEQKITQFTFDFQKQEIYVPCKMEHVNQLFSADEENCHDTRGIKY